jgi:hypothetical protein
MRVEFCPKSTDIFMHAGTLDLDLFKRQNTELALKQSKSILFLVPDTTLASEDLKVFDYSGMLKNWIEGPTLQKDDELYNIMLIQVREKSIRASMRTAFVTAPKYRQDQAERAETLYIAQFRKLVSDRVTDDDWIAAREMEEGRHETPTAAQFKVLKAAYKQKLDAAMKTVSFHAVFPFSHSSLCKQTIPELCEAQETARKEYDPESNMKLPVQEIIRHCGMSKLFAEIKEARNVKPDRQKLLDTIRVNREALQKRIEMKALQDNKPRRGMREVKGLAEDYSETRHEVWIKPEFEQWEKEVKQLYGHFTNMLKGKVLSAQGKQGNSAEFEKNYKDFVQRYTKGPQSAKIPINFFVGTDTATPTAKHAGPQQLIRTYFSDKDFAANVVAKQWEEHVRNLRQLLDDNLLPSIDTKVVASLKDRFGKSDNGIYDEISKLFQAIIKETVESSFVEPYHSSLPVQGKKAVPTGIREPLFRAARRIFQDDNGHFNTFDTKQEVLTTIYDKSNDVAGHMVSELFEWRKRGVCSESCLNHIMGPVYERAQKEADKLFRNKAKELGKEIDVGFLKAVVAALAAFEENIKQLEQMPDQRKYSEDLVSEILADLDSLEPNIEQDELVNSLLIAQINSVFDNPGNAALLRSEYKPDPRSRLYNPRPDGHCCYHALAAAR